jgi:spore coat polysaccharide biosynthesis protein SpsF (cytidylyltransferase family)
VPVLTIVQARLGSSRLPHKSLMDVGGRPLIAQVVARARQIRGVDDVVLAVPNGEVAKLLFCAHTTGPAVPEDDVLARFAMVLERYQEHDPIMRLTGDCPLLDPRICERVLQLYQTAPKCHYAWNVAPGYVDGEDCEVFSRAALLRAHREATDRTDREHVTPWIRRHYRIWTLEPDEDRSWLKTSVDTLDDLEYVRGIYARQCGTIDGPGSESDTR